MKRFAIVAVVLILALAGALVLRSSVTNHEDPIVIVHWSNSHPMRAGLLPEMAQAFNNAHHETSSGRPIEIQLVKCDSALQRDDLVSRVKGAGPIDKGCDGPNPTIITPQAEDWLVDVNQAAGRAVIDLPKTESIAKTFVGIVTYREIADCLGWRTKQIGYADIVRLVNNGWGSDRCVKSEWGKPLLAFTNPQTSTTGRSVLISLYAVAAGRASIDQLTLGDVARPEVQSYVKNFQQLVAHYMPGSIPLNTKIEQGKRYGHFFLMPEDNLVSLHNGTEKVIGPDGKERNVTPVKNLVMIYPREGSALNSNPAGVVRAPWVTSEAAKAAATWARFLREDAQQRDFMKAGFRPGTSLALTEPISPDFGLDPSKPAKTIDPARVDPSVLKKIMTSWEIVKKPAIVTFVVDTSGSMAGTKLDQAKSGLYRVLDNMAEMNKVGLVTFSDHVQAEAPVPLTNNNRLSLAERIRKLKASGGTALYDAVSRGVALSDNTDAAGKATRAVVVLSDGEANAGTAKLSDIVSLRSQSRDELPVIFGGMEGQTAADATGRPVAKTDVTGLRLEMPHQYPVQIFFIGFGDADINIGRILAQATGAEFQGSTDENLATVIDEFGAYF